MRTLVVMAVALGLAACAASGGSSQVGAENSPFPVARGSALPPPATAQSASRQAAPPQGVGPGGLDFGQWRSADPAVYGPALQTQVRQRLAGKSAAEMRADLEANGFVCATSRQLECRIEIFERQCAHDWYVVVEQASPAPIAGYDVMCLGAR